MDIRQLQLRILKIFLEFEKVCKEHNLRFYLCAGTMLGAVRHKGFIPWDDDMDVAMPREDYELLIKHSDEWFSYPYALDCREKNHLYPVRFAKVHDVTTTFYSGNSPFYVGGVYVDVFPVDGLPDGKRRQKLHIWKHRTLERLFYFSYRDPFKRGKRIDSYLFLFLQKLISSDRVYRMLRKTSTKYNFEISKYVTDHQFKYRGIMEKKVWGDTPSKVMFEGNEIYGLADWDYYLSHIYGNYMVPPPPEKREPKHNLYYLNMELPFREYKIPKSKK